jgi:hypothetical protein
VWELSTIAGRTVIGVALRRLVGTTGGATTDILLHAGARASVGLNRKQLSRTGDAGRFYLSAAVPGICLLALGKKLGVDRQPERDVRGHEDRNSRLRAYS